MMLAVGFAANIGGTGTLVGTAPNVVFYEFIGTFEGQPVTFGSWILFCFPTMMANILLLWLWLQIMFLGLPRCSEYTQN